MLLADLFAFRILAEDAVANRFAQALKRYGEKAQDAFLAEHPPQSVQRAVSQETTGRDFREKVVAYVMGFDPSPTRDYTLWLLDRWLRGGFRLEDLPDLRSYLDAFHRYRRDLPVQDITRVKTRQDLMRLVDPVLRRPNAPRVRGSVKDREMRRPPEAHVLRDDDAFAVVVPFTKEAAHYWGSSKWCITWGVCGTDRANHENHFWGYAHDGPFFIIADKMRKDVWALHLGDRPTLWDQEDESHVMSRVVQERTNWRKDLLPNTLAPYLEMRARDDRDEHIDHAHPNGLNAAHDEGSAAYAVHQHPDILANLRNPSEALQIIAVSKNPDILEHIENPSDRVVAAAVSKNPDLLAVVSNPGPEAVLAAVRVDGLAIRHVRNPSATAMLAAVRQNGLALEHIRDPHAGQPDLPLTGGARGITFSDIQLAAVEQNPAAMGFVPRADRSDGVRIAALAGSLSARDVTPPADLVAKSGDDDLLRALRAIPKGGDRAMAAFRIARPPTPRVFSPALALELVRAAPGVARDLREIADEAAWVALERGVAAGELSLPAGADPELAVLFAADSARRPGDDLRKSDALLASIKRPSRQLQLHVAKHLPASLGALRIRDPEVMREALPHAPEAVLHLPDATREEQIEAVRMEPSIIKDLPDPHPGALVAAANAGGGRYLRDLAVPPEAQLGIVAHNPRHISYISNPTREAALRAVEADPTALFHIQDPPPEAVIAAIDKERRVLSMMRKLPPEAQRHVLHKYPELLPLIDDPIPEVRSARERMVRQHAEEHERAARERDAARRAANGGVLPPHVGEKADAGPQGEVWITGTNDATHLGNARFSVSARDEAGKEYSTEVVPAEGEEGDVVEGEWLVVSALEPLEEDDEDRDDEDRDDEDQDDPETYDEILDLA